MAQQKKIIMKSSNSSTKSKSGTDLKMREAFPTKVIVRRLPPTLTSESFLEEVSPLPDHSYYSFVAADRSLGQYAFCRAVISFKNPDDVFLFREKFDNYVFVDPRGNEYPAVVEFAPYQKVPIVARKVDHRENTLDDDADYKKFLDILENPEAPPTVTVKEVIEEVEAKAKERLAAHNSETPLLAFINKFKIEKKRAQEKLREERRLREVERKRLRDEERRNRREREKRDRDEGKSTKENITSSDRKGDSKKSGSKDDSRSASRSSSKQDNSNKPNSASGKAGGSASATKTGSKVAEKGSTQKSYPKDDIIVRTLPSAKSKATDKSRGVKPTSIEAKKPTSAGKAPYKPSSDRPAAGSTSQTSSGKPESKYKQDQPESGAKSGSVSKPQQGAKQSQKPVRDTPPYKDKEKITAIQKKPEKRGDKGNDRSASRNSGTVSDVTEKTAALKLSDTAGKVASDKTPPIVKRNIAGHKLERSGSGDSGASDKNDGDRKKNRDSRYKDRPERAIYNPGARAAERRAKLEKSTSGTQQPESVSDKPTSDKPSASEDSKQLNEAPQNNTADLKDKKDNEASNAE